MLEKRAKELLYQFDIGPQYRGFDYFLSGVEILHHHPTYLHSITKCLYPEIAKIHKTTNSCVERDIRTVIEVLWKNGCNSLFASEIFSHKSYPASGKRPTNTQFFEMVMAYMEASAAASLPPCGSDACENCPVINSLHAELSALQEENQWMHDLIWQMIQKGEA